MTRRLLPCLLLATSLACGDSGGGPAPADDADATTPTEDAGAAEDTGPDVPSGPFDEWPAAVTQLGVIDQTVSGDLGDGAPVDLAWGGQPGVDCWIGVDPPQLRGHHVLYGLTTALPKTDEATVTVTPGSADLDLNVYAAAFEVGVHYVPPDVPYTLDCQKAWAAGTGEPETLTLRNLTEPYEWLIVVSGPEEATSGAYELALEIVD